MCFFQSTQNRVPFFKKIKNFEQIVLSNYLRFYRYNDDFKQTQINFAYNVFRNQFSHNLYLYKQKIDYKNIYSNYSHY